MTGGLCPHLGSPPHLCRACAQVSLSHRPLVADFSPEERKTGVGGEMWDQEPSVPPMPIPVFPVCPVSPEPTPCPPQGSQSTQGPSQHAHHPPVPLPSQSQPSQSPQCPPVPVPVPPASDPAPLLFQPPKLRSWPTAWSCCPSTTAGPQSDGHVPPSPAWHPDGPRSDRCVSLPSALCPDPVIPSPVLPKSQRFVELALGFPFLRSRQSGRQLGEVALAFQ